MNNISTVHFKAECLLSVFKIELRTYTAEFTFISTILVAVTFCSYLYLYIYYIYIFLLWTLRTFCSCSYFNQSIN